MNTESLKKKLKKLLSTVLKVIRIYSFIQSLKVKPFIVTTSENLSILKVNADYLCFLSPALYRKHFNRTIWFFFAIVTLSITISRVWKCQSKETIWCGCQKLRVLDYTQDSINSELKTNFYFLWVQVTSNVALVRLQK